MFFGAFRQAKADSLYTLILIDGVSVVPNVLSIRSFLFAMCSLWFLGVAEARPLYPIELPFQQFSCSTCHDGATSTASINEFAKDFRDAGYTWTEALCQEDSDGDGASNGEELLDPDCTWMRGQAARMGMANRPSDATDVPEIQAVEGSEDEGAQDDTEGANDNEPPGACIYHAVARFRGHSHE